MLIIFSPFEVNNIQHDIYDLYFWFTPEKKITLDSGKVRLHLYFMEILFHIFSPQISSFKQNVKIFGKILKHGKALKMVN